MTPELDLKVSSRFTTSLSASITTTTGTTSSTSTRSRMRRASTHYTFAHLEQRTFSLTWRLGYTFTPTTSLQVYASPFVSKGTYSDVREIADARASDYDARYRPYGDPAVAGDPGGFNFQQFRSNVVFRWEYRPGSTLFLVWSQGREGSASVEGDRVVPGRSGRSVRPAGGRYVPGEGVVLAHALTRPTAPPFAPAFQPSQIALTRPTRATEFLGALNVFASPRVLESDGGIGRRTGAAGATGRPRGRRPPAGRYLRACRAVALAVTGSAADADDVCQDAFVAAMERIDDCREPARFGGWLLQIVRNRARNHLRAPAPGREPLDDEAACGGPSPAEALDRHELRTAAGGGARGS